ncbi:MAG TPA: alpha/beta hydrolase [Burkholderiales bacterium]|nr:alpha/beta hydrolase [Burkholderiales bacterium]
MNATADTAPRSRYVDSGGLRLHHLDWGGKGRHPIVLVHGSRLHAHVWDDFGRRFRDRYHVIAVDQRGHGDSAWCGPADYQLEALYRDLRSVVEAQGLTRYTLIGHSLGGRVSMLYASRHQADIERLVLVDITPGRASVPAATQSGNGAQPRDFATVEAAVDYLSRAMSRAPRSLVEESVRHGLRRNDEGRHVWKYDPVLFRQRVPLPPGVDLWDAMSTVNVPTLLQYGSESDVVNAELAERLRATMPRCTVERIEGAGHGLFTDRPDAFSESVERFLTRS